MFDSRLGTTEYDQRLQRSKLADDGFQFRQQCVFNDHGSDRRPFQRVQQLRAFVGRVEWQLNRPDARQAKPQIQIFQPIVQEQRHTLTLADTQRVQGRRHAVCAAVGFSVGDTLIPANRKYALADTLRLLAQDVCGDLLRQRQPRQEWRRHEGIIPKPAIIPA